MARDDMLRRYQEAWAELFEATRARAEDLFREVVRIGESAQKEASGRVDEVREGGWRGADQFIDAVRRELTNQVAQFSFATKADVARIEARLDALEARVTGSPAAAKTAPAAKTAKAAKKAPPAPAGAGAPGPAAKKASGTKKAAGKRAAPAKKAAGGADEASR